MAEERMDHPGGEELVRRELITREELDRVRETAAQSGVPWYRALVQARKIGFETLEGILRYEFHSPSSRKAHNTLGESLVRRGSVTRAQLEEALGEQSRSGRLLGSILLERGFVTRRAIALALAEQTGMEFADLDKTPSAAEALDAVPHGLCLKCGRLPVALEGDRLTVLVTSPQARERVQEVGVLLGRRMHALLTASDNLADEIRSRYQELEEVEDMHGMPEETEQTPAPRAREGEEAMAQERGGDEGARFTDLARQAQGTPVVKLVSTILEGAVNAGATDIHLDPQDPETRVRYRIDGVLHDVMSLPRAQHHAVVSRVKILADMDITETRHPQDGHLKDIINGRNLDIRVATLPTVLGERVVMRLLDQAAVLAGIRDLGMDKADEKTMLRLIGQPYGMILVTGPTGSGKTTTLYAALNQKNVLTESIVTIEDPVEYQLPGINQVQVDTDIGLTFAATLRATLRQDIDVLLIGEIRDVETAQIAVRAAMTGHLVFSTLHTNDAVEAVGTLRNMGIAPFLISAALTAVVGQRLVRKICPECKKAYKPGRDLLEALRLPEDTKRLHRGAGCPACHHTGTRGRTGVFEILEVTPQVRALILDEAGAEAVAEGAGMRPMAENCRAKILEGVISAEEYLRVVRA